MQKPKHHIFVCGSYRTGGEAKGSCHKRDSTSLLGYIESELGDRGMDEVVVTGAGCMNRCEKGPLMVIYPEAYWYGEVNEDKADTILDALGEGRPVESLLLT